MAQYPSSAADDSNLYVAVNNKNTTLVGALIASGGNYSATEIEVANTAGFPSTGLITIDTEVISYTGVATSPHRFTGITRGQDGTAAASHNNGAFVYHHVVAAHHNVLKDEIKAIEDDLINGMTNPLKIQDGLASAPALSFENDPNTGIYRNGADYLAIATNGTIKFQCTPTFVESNVQHQFTNGTAGSPGITFAADTDTGVYLPGTNELAFATGGTQRWRVTASGSLVIDGTNNPGGLVLSGAGSASEPAYSQNVGGGATTGMFFLSPTQVAFTTNGTARWKIDGSGNLEALPGGLGFYASNGTAATPGMSFTSDPDTGIYRSGTNQLDIVTGGATAMRAGNSTDGNRTTWDWIPDTNNTQKLGRSTNRWTEVHATNGTIQTSHSSTKEILSEIDPITYETPRGIFFKRPGNERIHVGFEADLLPKEAFYEDGVSVETSSVIGVLCAKVRYLEAELQRMKGSVNG